MHIHLFVEASIKVTLGYDVGVLGSASRVQSAARRCDCCCLLVGMFPVRLPVLNRDSSN